MASACGLLRAASAARPFAPSSSSARCRAALSSSRRRRRRAARVVDVSARAVIDVENDDEEERFPPPPPPSLGPGPLPLLDPTKGYTHVSPGVCDACANDVDARIAWVALLLGQLPSHRANATRTRDMLVGEGKLEDAETFMDRYALWERDYEAYLASVSLDDKAPGEGATLLDMVREKERLLRARGFDDLFAGMKAEENEIATALYRPIGLEIDDIWEPTPGALYGPGEHPDPNAKANMIRAVIECCLAGNLFDAGSASAVQARSTGPRTTASAW